MHGIFSCLICQQKIAKQFISFKLMKQWLVKILKLRNIFINPYNFFYLFIHSFGCKTFRSNLFLLCSKVLVCALSPISTSHEKNNWCQNVKMKKKTFSEGVISEEWHIIRIRLDVLFRIGRLNGRKQKII